MSDSIQDDDNAEKQSTDVEISFDAVDLIKGIFKLKLINFWLKVISIG